MNAERTFKKELPRDKLLSIVLSYLKKIDKEHSKIKITKLLETMTAEIVTAETCRLWIVDHEKKTFFSETFPDDKRVEIPWGKGLLSKGLKEANAFYVNRVKEDKHYDASIDNIGDHAIKDIIILPVTDDTKKVLFIFEAATAKRDLQQFTENDLDTLHSILPYLTDMYPLLLEDRSQKTDAHLDEDVKKTIATLKEDKKRAEAMVDSSTQFLAEVAHEIRTPMNAVMGFIELLQVDEKDKEKQIYLESAAKSGEMMIALINDLLDFAKIEKGMMELEDINFNPIEEFSAMAPLFCARMKKKDILFKLYIDPMLPKEVVSDPHRIKQILSNLIGNAIKFTPKRGEITLEVLYNKRSKRIDFNVIDTGIGIAKKNQHKIFEAYTQETSSTSRKFGGTGLGLSISSRLAEKLGDKLQLESEEGKGSRFYFSLLLKDTIIKPDSIFDLSRLKGVRPALVFSKDFAPTEELVRRYLNAFGIKDKDILYYDSCRKVDKTLCTHLLTSQDLIDYPKAQKTLDDGIPITVFKQTAFDFYTEDLTGSVTEIECTFGPDRLYDVLTPNAIQAEETQKHTKTTPHILRKVLVVDDNHLNVHFMREIVKKLGALAESASDGDEAVEIYKRVQAWKDPFDLILMDENMPHMNGTEAAKIITALEKEHNYPHTPIIGISGDATEEQRERSIASGMDECIFKPVGIKKITEVFQRFINEK